MNSYLKMIPLILIAKSNKISEAYLDDFIGKNNIAERNILGVYPLKNELAISQIRDVKKQLTMSSSSTRLIILYQFDRAATEAQNSLLKSLEENSLDNQFILVVSNSEQVLPTIRSRAKIINLVQNVSLESQRLVWLKLFLQQVEKSEDCVFLADASLSGLTKDKVLEFIDNIIYYYRLKLKKNYIYARILNKSLRLKNLIENNNLNPQLTFDNLLIFINKTIRMKE
ncbi:hypothetical protein A2774_01285 [Candidatus Roizmanbacteria bacterium RIFCSPHIGHO2_01_FULL_39_12c]|uniref:DNA polymerase III delta N-terminal domain-containing protein n=1 Tax=Candidatus Roizmanbacteria bacterium RIFCSPHIGHO2_01_FULL_39_12c TaxID=1802031 RepID=A0A1F7GDX0_9BACT|nr:MAG: hypothetical protein A2774_01285 [Candidatus Roizmanbacteria bacterium RIFCSPHIGHO2_01_FULL_39_12c]